MPDMLTKINALVGLARHEDALDATFATIHRCKKEEAEAGFDITDSLARQDTAVLQLQLIVQRRAMTEDLGKIGVTDFFLRMKNRLHGQLSKLREVHPPGRGPIRHKDHGRLVRRRQHCQSATADDAVQVFNLADLRVRPGNGITEDGVGRAGPVQAGKLARRSPPTTRHTCTGQVLGRQGH